MKNNKPIIIVIEGVDCVGKTTLAKLVAKKYDFLYIYTPEPPLANLRKDIELIGDYNIRFFYYLTSVIAIQKKIQDNISLGKNIIIDRYIYSTFVMHQMLGVDTDCIDASKLPICWPDISILLTAKSDTRIMRMRNRNRLERYDHNIESLTKLLDKAQDKFISTYNWSLILKTDDIDPEKLENKLISYFDEFISR